MWRGCGPALLLAVGCTRTDKSAEAAADPAYSDAATTGYDTDIDAETDLAPGTDTSIGPPPLAWVSLDGGFVNTCGLLNDQRVVCWGEPYAVAATPTGAFTQISVGGWEGCGILADGTLTCWCRTSAGADNAVCEGIPRGTGWVEVRTATHWACAERADRTVECWGSSGQPNAARSEPVESVADWSIEAGFGCAVLDDGTVTCWGDTDLFTLNKADATTAPPPDRTYVQVAAGRTHACALDDTGEVVCWGSTQSDQGIDFPQPSPGPWASITAWNAFTCGLRADGSSECWFDLPGLVNDEWSIPDEKWASLGLGEWDSCGITLDGRGVCFPEAWDSLGEQDIPDLADLALPE